MKSVEEMMRDFDGLIATDIQEEFPNENSKGYVERWLCRIVYETRDGYRPDDPIIEFYSLDTNQFVSAYFVATFMETDRFGGSYGTGLDLAGDVYVWSLTAADADEIREWIDENVDY